MSKARSFVKVTQRNAIDYKEKFSSFGSILILHLPVITMKGVF